MIGGGPRPGLIRDMLGTIFLAAALVGGLWTLHGAGLSDLAMQEEKTQ